MFRNSNSIKEYTLKIQPFLSSILWSLCWVRFTAHSRLYVFQKCLILIQTHVHMH